MNCFVVSLALSVMSSVAAASQVTGSAQTGITEHGSQWHDLARGGSTGENGWPVLAEAIKKTKELIPQEGASRAGASLEEINGVIRGSVRPGSREFKGVRKALRQVEGEGVFAKIDSLSGSAVIARPAQPGDMILWELPELSEMRLLARALTAHIQLSLHDGDFDAALKSFERIMLLGRISAQQPILIHYLVGIACDALAVQAMRDSLPDPRWTVEALDRLQSATEMYLPLPPLSLALRGERLIALDLVGSVYGEEGKPDVVRIAEFIQGRSDWIAEGGVGGEQDILQRLRLGIASKEQVVLAIEEYYRGAIEAAELPPGKSVREVATFHERATEAIDFELVVFGLVIPNLPTAAASQGQFEAMVAGLRTSIALEIHQRMHGRYPAALDELVPGVLASLPRDPYSDEPLRYSRDDGKSYMLYAVGVDGVDNGGRATVSAPYVGAGLKGDGFDVLLTPAGLKNGR